MLLFNNSTSVANISLTSIVIDVLCFGGNNASISTVVSGGTTPYTYQWSNSEITDSIGGLIQGNYSIQVLDSNLCSLDSSFVINQPAAPLLLSATSEEVLCFGGNDGSIDLTVTGGTFSYSYLWNTLDTTQDLTSLSVGNYTVVITDSNSCIDSLSINVNNFNNEIFDFLKSAEFINSKSVTDKGEYLLSKAYAYGVTESYMKTFIHIEDLAQNKIQGIANKIDDNNNEYHVNRALNVWGSGHSHTTYFKHIDNYVIDIFNQPLENQPIGVADMGCGDGALLHHLNELIKTNTLRGKHLKSHPLFLIGADFNQAALNETNKMFSNASNKPMTVLADISKPDEYAKKVKKMYSFDISDFLNVRSFLDHNRRYESSHQKLVINFKNKTNNAFCWRGKRINSQDIQTNLVDHFKKWKKYISKYGLLALELHSIKIEDITKNIGKAPVTAYIATHGFSDQFINGVDFVITRHII